MKKVLTAILAVVAAMLIIGILGAKNAPKDETVNKTAEQNVDAGFWAAQIVDTFTSDYSRAVSDVNEDTVMVYIYIDDLATALKTAEYSDFCAYINGITHNCHTATDNEIHFWVFAFDSANVMNALFVSLDGENVTEDF